MTSLVFILLTAAQPVPAPPPRPVPELRDRSEAYYHFSLGLQARFSGETQTSLEEYRKAQKLDPGSAAIRVETARLLREAGKIDEALAEAREAVRLDKDNSDAHLALAQLYQLQAAGPGGDGSLRKAAAEFEEVVRLQPADRETLVTLASLYGQQLQDHKEAARIWQLYVGLDPGSFEAHLQVGTHLLAAGQPEKAAAALKDALELQPGSPRVYQTLGDIYAQAEQTDQAVLHYRKALEIEPANVRVRLGLTETLYRARRYKEALAEADLVLGADARNRFALNLKGQALRDLREFDAAEEAADAILAEAGSGFGQDPGERQAAYLQGAYLKVQIAEGRRDFAAAASQLETILARNHSGEDAADAASRDRVFLIHLGFAYQQQAKFSDAANAFGRAKRVGGDPDAALLGYHAEALYLAKQLDQALTEVRSARSRFPDDPDLTGLQAGALPWAAICRWPARPSAWASAGLISLSSSCAPRRSSNGSHWVLSIIWVSPGAWAASAARRLGDNAVQVRERYSLAERAHSMVNMVHCQE